MSKQVLLCVETNKTSDTDYKYISETIKYFYQDDRKVSYKPIYLGSKARYNAPAIEKDIARRRKLFHGETSVIYFIDVDDYDTSIETKNLYTKIKSYCDQRDYEFVFFTLDIEDVYVGRQIPKNEKVKVAADFARKKMINKISEKNLRSDAKRKHCSNILNVLDKFWER